MNTDIQTTYEWLAEHLLGWVFPDAAWEWQERNPWLSIQDWLDTGDGMLAVIEAMRAKGFSCGMFFSENGVQHGAMFYQIGARPYPAREVLEHLHREQPLGMAGNLPLPEAVALAAKAALESQNE